MDLFGIGIILPDQATTLPDNLMLASIVFLVSIWNASVGPSGAISFASLAAILPPTAVVPIHAIVESTSALSRSLILWEEVDWSFILPFLVGGLGGFFVSMTVFEITTINDNVLRVALGATILIVLWVPMSSLPVFNTPAWSFSIGLVTSCLTVFVGATSPLVTSMINRCTTDHRSVLATSAVCMLFQHGGKIVVFSLIGFAFSHYSILLAMLLPAAVAGTWIGRSILIRVSQHIIKPIFKTIVTIIGCHLIWLGLA